MNPPSGIDPWELAAWDAVETAERVRRRDVTSAEVVDAALARANDARTLNAVVTLTADRARTAARTASTGPLFGVPTFVKDLAQMSGVRTAWGSAASGEFVSTRSEAFVVAFERMGLLSLGKSATPELGLTATTEPLAFGPCRNPWAPERSAGGSSGGAAALVAAGVVPLAHASDGGGSIRIPAACCGLVGLKPSRRRFDMEGSNLLPVNVAVQGVLTRTVRDTVAFWNALEAQVPSPTLAPIGAVPPRPARRLRLGVFVDSPLGTVVHPDVRASVERAASRCASLGHAVEPIACPFAEQPVRDFLRLWGFLAWAQSTVGRLLMHRGFDAAKLDPWTRGFSRYFTSERRASFAAIRRLRGFAAVYASKVARYDVLLFPTLGELPPILGHLAPDVPFEVALERLLSFSPFTALVNAAGAPAISLPLGESASGLPVGVQFAAAHGDDRLLLALAHELEEAYPWTRAAPRDRFA